MNYRIKELASGQYIVEIDQRTWWGGNRWVTAQDSEGHWNSYFSLEDAQRAVANIVALHRRYPRVVQTGNVDQ